MAKQTAVDWFEKNYHELLVEASINNMHVVLFDKKRGELFEQAKAMSREQIEEAHLQGQFCLKDKRGQIKASEYYNETYGK